jgi:hypothetical protein
VRAHEVVPGVRVRTAGGEDLRDPSAHDRRSQHLQTTDAGRALASRATTLLVQGEKEAFTTLSEAEQMMLAELLHKLACVRQANPRASVRLASTRQEQAAPAPPSAGTGSAAKVVGAGALPLQRTRRSNACCSTRTSTMRMCFLSTVSRPWATNAEKVRLTVSSCMPR